jgi:hypothetical protein
MTATNWIILAVLIADAVISIVRHRHWNRQMDKIRTPLDKTEAKQ